MLSELSLLKRKYVKLDDKKVSSNNLSIEELATLMSNFVYFGYIPNNNVVSKLQTLDKEYVYSWYSKVEKNLKKVTGEDKDIGSHVVYKNFPTEVLEMSETEYWFRQVLVYFGVPYEIVSGEEVEREEIDEKVQELKVLSQPCGDFENRLKEELIKTKSAWSKDQENEARELKVIQSINVSDFGYRQNAINLIATNMDKLSDIKIEDATDVLRVALALGQNGKIGRLKRSHRKVFLKMLEGSKNLEEDVLLNKTKWKTFLHMLHPNEYRLFNRVQIVFNKLLKNELKGFNSTFEEMLAEKNIEIFSLLKTRAGFFANRLFNLYRVFGFDALKEFVGVIENVNTKKLLKLKSLVIKNKNSVGDIILTKSGKGFTVVKKYGENKGFQSGHSERFAELTVEKTKWLKNDKKFILDSINEELSYRIFVATGLTEMKVDGRLKSVKFKNNETENISFGSGTVVDIPENVKTIRTASYWSKESLGAYWVDNTINTFDEAFRPVGTCCWNSERASGMVFSGDPVIGGIDGKTKAAQLIDVDIEKIRRTGARYVIFSLLSYNGVNFESFGKDNVYGMVQFCEEPEKGELFEPSRCVLSFDVGESKSKDNVFVIFDIEARKMVFVDKSLGLKISSGLENRAMLSHYLSVAKDSLDSEPSVYDLLSTIHKVDSKIQAIYSDDGVDLDKNYAHYVFDRVNKENDVDFYELEHFL